MNEIHSDGKYATLETEFWIMTGQLERKALKSSFMSPSEILALGCKGNSETPV